MKRSFLLLVFTGCVNLVATPENPPTVVETGDATRGAVAVIELGCAGCHPIADPGFQPVGPDLTNVGRKLGREWIYTRLLHPGRVVTGSRESKHGWARPAVLAEYSDEALAVALTAGLTAGHTRLGKPMTSGDAARGRALYNRNGCSGCHGDVARGFAGEGSKVSAEWLDKWLADPTALAPTTTMPHFDLSPSERADLVKLLSGQYAGTVEATWPRPTRELSEQLAALTEQYGGSLEHAGRELGEAFGCHGCHAGLPPQAPTAPGLPALATPEGRAYTLELWQPKGEHPQFVGQQAALVDIAAWLSTSLNLPPPEVLTYRRLGCTGCHLADGPGPDLRDVVDKHRIDWLADFLAEPQPLRPKGPRMPRYALHTDELRDLVRVLLRGVDPYERLELAVGPGASATGCSNCHDKNAPKLAQVQTRLRPSYVLRYLHTHPTQTDDAGALQRARAVARDNAARDNAARDKW